MAYRKRKRRKSDASVLIIDTIRTANRISWRGALLLGVILFIVFYWAVPTFVDHQLVSLQSSQLAPIAELRLSRMAHGSQRLAIALWLACTIIAGFNYFRARHLTYEQQRGVGFFSRLLARFLD